MTYIQSLEALADPNRRKIVDHLKIHPSSVGDLTKLLSISQPAVSQHLSVLKNANLVSVRKEGNRRIYSLANQGLDELRNYVNLLWGDALSAFEEEAKKLAKGETND